MGSYPQWHTTISSTGVRRVTWVCGDQPVLIEEIVDRTRALVAAAHLDSVNLTAGTVPDGDIFAATHQYPVHSGGNRLVVVRDASKIKRWDPLHTWLAESRRLAGSHLVFVAGTADLPTGTGPLAKAVEAIKAKRSLSVVVRATQLNQDDAHAWLRRRAPRLSDYVAAHLLARVGGNLLAAAHVAAKLSLFDATAGTATIDALVERIPNDTFVDAVLHRNRRDAFAAAPTMTDDDALRAVGTLDQRLDLLDRLRRGLATGRRPHEIPGVNPYLGRRYATIAPRYDPRRSANCRHVLAVVDAALRSGARTGCLETLVALW